MALAPFEIASTLQAASIDRNPLPHRSINPSTSFDTRIPVEPALAQDDSTTTLPSSPSAFPIRPHQPSRRLDLPPLPDLRFEQSYLRSIPEGASLTRIGWITFRDQVFMPLLQGTLWTLGLAWWRHWNRGAQMAGENVGARLRRWWWRVNDWKLPSKQVTNREFMARNIKEFYQTHIGTGIGD